MHKINLRRALAAAATLALVAVAGSAQPASNPRFGHWKLKSDAPAPQSNIMSYEPYNGKGMTVTIDQVNKDGSATKWGYNTMFDGKDEPLYGNPGQDTGSVRVITPAINEIVYKKGGKVVQVLVNVLSPDGQKLGITYFRQNAEGKTTGVTFATYEKMN